MAITEADKVILEIAETELERVRERIAEHANAPIVIHAFGVNFLRICGGYGMKTDEFDILIDKYKDLYKDIYENFVKGMHDHD